MATRKRRPIDDVTRIFHTFLYHRDAAAAEGKAKEKAAKELREFTKLNGMVELDEAGNEVSGNIQHLLDDPVQVGGKVYRGMELRKQSQISFDEEAALTLAKARKIPLADVVSEVTLRMGVQDFETISQYFHWEQEYGIVPEFAVNQDAFYVLNQQKKITDADLDSLLVEGEPKYSFWPIQGAE